jgi:hypothetical protein
MDLNYFLHKVPYLYHLTDRRNLDFILGQNRLYSTVELVEMSSNPPGDNFLRNKRFGHAEVEVNGFPIRIRDQKPLNAALGRSLLNGWTPEQWIYHLNRRVFTWPNLNRLRRHFATYQNENPIILRLITQSVIDLNPVVELCRINSGDSRCIGHYGGNPVPRGVDTFASIADYGFNDVAEVTFPNGCQLPHVWEIGDHPDGPWRGAQ